MLAVGAIALTIATRASAEEQTSSTENAPAKEEEPRRPFAITVNPLGPIIQRYGANFEYSPSPHIGFAATLAFINVTHRDLHSTSSSSVYATGGVAEIGPRYYTGKSGPVGFYIGPSLLLGMLAIQSSTSSAVFGGALDVGVQGPIGSTILVGGGLGLQYTRYGLSSLDRASESRDPALRAGLSPRLLLTLGARF